MEMKTAEWAKSFSRQEWGKSLLIYMVSFALFWATCPQGGMAFQYPGQAPPQYPQGAPQGQPAGGQVPPYAQSSPQQLQQLVAPIALYPDQLVAQILAASTFPEQVVEADRWLHDHPGLHGDALAQAVNQMPWDPSVKGLTAFPDVLGNMDKNLSWTSSLGNAYYNQQPAVMDAVQVMRQRAEASGNLRSTPQQTVTNQGSTIVVTPAQPDVVYVPAYDPWIVYGAPIWAWPGWYPYPGIWFGGPYLSFGVGFGVGFFGGFGWGWGHWGFNWGGHFSTFGGGRYFARSNTFYNRGGFNRGGAFRGGAYATPRGEGNARAGAYGGYNHGGNVRSYSGHAGGGFHGGGFGGGFHGGGGGRHR
jgi:hypothetical protein